MDDIFVHVWGLEDVSSTSSSGIANLGAQNGNMWANAVNNGFNVYNLGSGNLMTSASSDAYGADAAVQVIDIADTAGAFLTSTTTLDLSGHALGMSDYDYLVIGFARDTDGEVLRLDNINVTAIPEPATLGLIAIFGFGGLFIRRLMF